MHVGILGGGQLGRMLALAGYPLGLRFRCFDPAPHPPAGPLVEHVCAAYGDRRQLDAFCVGLDVATFEFESVPASTVYAVHCRVPVYPHPRALDVLQDRLSEKTLLRRLGIPTAPFAAVESAAEIRQAFAALGGPSILKIRRAGYDGRGQVVGTSAAAVEDGWRRLGEPPAILESVVPFARELSLIAVRGRNGDVRYYPLVENRHVDGVLRWTIAPASAPVHLQRRAERYADAIFDAFRYVGALTIELFEHDGELLVNEVSPRVHNSGHWTIEGAETNQFENHLRAVLGWPLGSTAARGCAVMLNILGTPPDPERTAALLQLPNTHVHFYDKAPRHGRKLGHVTATLATPDDVSARLRTLRDLVAGDAPTEDLA